MSNILMIVAVLGLGAAAVGAVLWLMVQAMQLLEDWGK